MTPKPIIKERRDMIREWLRESGSDLDYVDELLAAEQYWREAVKNADPEIFSSCQFCEADMIFRFHKGDCPWKLAQDEA